jgi:hypothetical protein
MPQRTIGLLVFLDGVGCSFVTTCGRIPRGIAITIALCARASVVVAKKSER